MDASPLHIKTPLIYSQLLKNKFGQSVYFKLESLQPPGSFKIRGIGRLCQYYATQGIKQFVASSGGNSGIAVAYCGMILNIPTTVFIPTTSHEIYINEIKSYGASVRVAGDVWDDAHQAAVSFAKAQHAAYIPPFEHPKIWEGHATIIQEIAEVGVKPDAIIVAVGGGGLACGLLEGMQKQSWDEIALVAVETEGADSFAASLKAMQLVTLDKITSRATSLGVKRITPRLWQWSEERDIISVVISDDAAEAGARAFAADKRMLVEIAAGAPLSLVYTNHPSIRAFQSIVVIVCGGINTTFF